MNWFKYAGRNKKTIRKKYKRKHWKKCQRKRLKDEISNSGEESGTGLDDTVNSSMKNKQTNMKVKVMFNGLWVEFTKVNIDNLVYFV